ncbi:MULTISPECIES: bacteriohemerythrin [Carboxydocella]|uniref:Hemerythrin n=2 Tax=Carboxydocella TaxID=178898 RepID=A0A1T4M4P9_9FIRM|nr:MULTISPECIES: bacteriohemerythrin [Carboxydocella]AVX21045.1 hemerythrin [Carboxydocella thermautotrophica]AVX31465.1 hemerythrin [Carboxydocella thermautotrophica]SJZ61891.1 hemerythrin [Carboxydocella sporoproducens DSM 16521]GAW28801.1 hemerythrin [Carboxydocella sp. ULO1]GAW32631.1 hemerythrin [Carboxydocella sp. JDF658]
MAVNWTPALAVGVAEIDRQHQELFRRIDNLLTAMSQGKGKEEVGNILKFLEDYVVVHFTAEEKLMQSHNYPAFNEHLAQHQAFIQDFAKLKEQFNREGPSTMVVLAVQRRVVDWLREHISQRDKAIGEFLQKGK